MVGAGSVPGVEDSLVLSPGPLPPGLSGALLFEEDTMETMNNIKAIKTFFELDGGRPVAMIELRELTKDERQELGDLCREALSGDN